MQTPPVKPPSPWLAVSISATALVAFVVWAYIQMRHWSEPGADYVSMAGNIAFTLLLWAIFIWAALRNFKDARRAKVLRTSIVTLNDEIKTLRASIANTASKPTQERDVPTALSSEQPLIILSARWGIGGDAYKDVTDIVRNNAKLDSVNLPASIGLFGDPYPNVPKHLNVAYLIGRRWDVSVPEEGHLILPEKEGEEQARKEQEQRRARLAALRREVSLSQAETRTYNALKTDFDAMPWAEKWALRLIYQKPLIHFNYLEVEMRNYGFGRDLRNDILVPLLSRAMFVKVSDVQDIERHPLNAKTIEELLAKWEEYPF